MITKAQNSSGCESKVYNITPESCFDKRVEDFRIKEIEFNPITKKLVIKQSPDVIISTDILQLNDVSEPTHLSPVEDIVDNIPSNAESGVSYILRVEDKYYHCTWRDTLKYWDRIQLKDGYEFFNKKDSKEYRYNNGALVDISTIHLSMKINQDNIQILNSSGDGVTLPVASPTTPGLFSKEDKTKLDSITKYVKEISFSGADTLVLDIVSSDGTKSLPIREANINQNGLMSKEACLNLSRLLNTVTNNIYTKEEVQELLNKKVDVAPGKDLLDTSQIFKINQIFDYVENVEYAEANNRASLKVTTKDPTIGESSSKILSFPDVSSAISGLMSPKYKDYIDSLKSYYTGDPTKEYTGQDLQIIFPIYDPISKKVTSKYLVLDAATSSTAGLITAMEKNKLGNISSIVQAVSDNTYNSNSVILNLVTNNPQTGTEEPVQIVFKSATSEKAGVMSSSDKGKLDNVVKYLTDLIDTDTTSATQAIIHYQSYNPFLNTYEDKYYSLPMATSTIAGSITSTDFNVIQGLKDVNGTPLTYEGTPSKTWKVGDQILKNEKEGFSVRNGDDTEYGDLIVRNLTIKEDIVFGGDAFIIDTEEVKVTDNILTLNSGEQGEGVTKGISGLEIDRGKLPNYFIIFDESDDRFKCGTEGNQFPLMLRDNEPDMVDGAFLTWNSTFKRAQTTSTVPIQLALRFALQNLSEKDTDIIFKRVDNDLYLQYGDTNDKYLSLRVLDDILFKSSPSATKYVFDKEIWAPAFKRDDGYESAYLDKDIEDRKFLQYDSSKKLIHSSNTVYSDKGGLDFVDNIDDTNCIKLISNSKTFGIINYENFTSIEDSQPYWSFIISPRNTLTRDGTEKISILDIYTATHNAFGFTNPLILDYVKSYIGFGDHNHKFYGDAASFTFNISGDTIQFIPSPDRSLINTKSSELGFSASIIIPTGLRSSDLSQIVFANYANLSKKYLSWDSSTNAITSIDGFDSLVVVNPDDPSKKVTLVYTNGGFSIVSDSNVPGISQNVLKLSETIGSDGSVTYNLNSTYTPLHVNFPMWGNFCDKDGKPFATVESLVGHYLPLSAGSTNALTGPLYFSPTSALVNKTDAGENVWALFMGDSTNGTSLYIGGFGDYETLIGGDLGNTALLNIDNSGNSYVTRLGYTDVNGNIKSGIITSGNDQNSQTTIHTIGDNDIKHYKNGAEYTVYDTSNLNVEELLLNYTLEGNIIGTPKATRIKYTLSDSFETLFLNNFRESIWGVNDSTSWIVPFRSNSGDSGLGPTTSSSIGFAVEDTHAYISISPVSNNRSVIIGGGNNGKINWFEQVAFKSDINKLSSKYYPYSGRGYMTIGADGRPTFTNNQGILFNRTSGVVEGIYVTPNNHLNIGGSQSNNVPVDIYNDLNITRILDRATNFSLLVFSNGDTEDSQYTHIGAEHGTTRIRSGLFNLVHDREGTLYTVLDTFNVSSDLYENNLNSLGKFPRLSAQTFNVNATPDREYPIQEAGSLINIPGVYNGSSQIYGTFDSNRWFVRGGANKSNDPTTHTSWKELATTTHLSGYLPLTGGTLTGSLNIGDSSQNAYNYIRIHRNNYTFETTVSEGSGILSLRSSNSGVTPTTLKIFPGGHAYINDEELATTSRLNNYLPLSGGTMSGNIMFPTSEVYIVQTLKSTSNYGAPIRWMVGNETRAMIGYHTTGGDGTAGAIIITPTNPGSSPWENGNGLFIDRNKIYFNGSELAKVSQIPSTSNYLPLSGGTLTRTTSGPVLSLKNTSANKEVYMDFYKGNVRCGYVGAAASSTEDMYLCAYDSRNIIIDTLGLVRFGTGASNLIHRKNGTDYTILDTSNIYSLTIQFNGSTNTTYAPNAPKTVNITPAAIGAAASSHTHNYAASPSAGGPATYILDSGGGSNNIQLAYKGYGLTASTASHLVGIDKTLVNGCRVFRDITPSEVRTLIEAAPSSHTHTKSQITDFPSSMPASDVYAWAKASSKPSYSYSEVGAAAASHTHTTIKGTYTGSGGSQPPSYVTAGTLRANMMYYNMSGSPYCDWLMMDTYIGSDVPYVTMIGVTKTATPRAFIASGPKGNASTSSWVRKELATVDAIPTTMAWGNITGVPATATRWPSWSEITSKPSTFTPSSHTHPLSDISDLQASWDALLKAAPSAYVTRWPSWSEVTSKPSTFTPSSHTHPLSDISDLQASWDALLKAAPSAYVTRWPSWSEVTSKPSFATVATSGSYNDLSNKPSIPSAETAATIMSKINSQSEITFTKHVVCSAGAGTSSTSDIRFKSNFNSLPDDTLNKVLNAPEFTYNWKDETTTSIGTSAQYWEDKIPELVHEMEDGTKTFSYERYTVVLQKALKEEHRLREEEKKRFKEEIDSLNTRLNDLTSLIQKLI